MYYDNSRLVFPPSDVVQFVDSPFASWMERFSVNPDQVAQVDSDDSFMSLLQDKAMLLAYKVSSNTRLYHKVRQ